MIVFLLIIILIIIIMVDVALEQPSWGCACFYHVKMHAVLS